MLSAIRDLVSAVAIAMVFAFSNGQQKWIWSQLAQLRQQILKESRQDWGCTSIFDKSACSRPR